MAAVLGALVGLGSLDRLDYALLDLAFAMRGARQPATSILIVTIDEDSFDVLNSSWLFSREVFARAIRRISEDGAVAIGLNIIFAEPSLRGPADDQALADALAAAGNVVLGSVPFLGANERASQLPFRKVASVREGVVGFLVDDDGAVRRAGQTMSAGNRRLPSFAAALYQRAVRAGVNATPLPSQPEVIINYAGGPGTFPWTPLHRVLHGEVPAKTFRGKIVLLGPTSPVLHDIFRASFAHSGGMPGVEIHATVLENYLRGISLRETPRWSGALLAAVGALVASILVARTGALSALGVRGPHRSERRWRRARVLLLADLAAWSRSLSLGPDPRFLRCCHRPVHMGGGSDMSWTRIVVALASGDDSVWQHGVGSTAEQWRFQHGGDYEEEA